MDQLRKLYGFTRRVYGHFFIRPFQRYNAENRAFKLLDKMEKSDKPLVTAPKHKPTKAFLEQLIKEHPELMQKVNATPAQQLENLKQVRVNVEVVCHADNVKIESEESREEARKLPQDRAKPKLFEMGVKDPAKVPVGKISLREAIDMIRGHALDPETFNVEYLAEFHEMQPEDVFNILDRFKTYNVYNNDEKEASKLMPWYTEEKLQYFFLRDTPLVYGLPKAEQEEERRKAWKEYLEQKKKQKVDPKMIEFAGFKAIPARSKKSDADKDSPPPPPPLPPPPPESSK